MSFADDIEICKSIYSLNDHDTLQHVIDNLTKCSSDWLLTCHFDKCTVCGSYKEQFSGLCLYSAESYIAVYIQGERLVLLSILSYPLMYILL